MRNTNKNSVRNVVKKCTRKVAEFNFMLGRKNFSKIAKINTGDLFNKFFFDKVYQLQQVKSQISSLQKSLALENKSFEQPEKFVEHNSSNKKKFVQSSKFKTTLSVFEEDDCKSEKDDGSDQKKKPILEEQKQNVVQKIQQKRNRTSIVVDFRNQQKNSKKLSTFALSKIQEKNFQQNHQLQGSLMSKNKSVQIGKKPKEQSESYNIFANDFSTKQLSQEICQISHCQSFEQENQQKDIQADQTEQNTEFQQHKRVIEMLNRINNEKKQRIKKKRLKQKKLISKIIKDIKKNQLDNYCEKKKEEKKFQLKKNIQKIKAQTQQRKIQNDIQNEVVKKILKNIKNFNDTKLLKNQLEELKIDQELKMRRDMFSDSYSLKKLKKHKITYVQTLKNLTEKLKSERLQKQVLLKNKKFRITKFKKQIHYKKIEKENIEKFQEEVKNQLRFNKEVYSQQVRIQNQSNVIFNASKFLPQKQSNQKNTLDLGDISQKNRQVFQSVLKNTKQNNIEKFEQTKNFKMIQSAINPWNNQIKIKGIILVSNCPSQKALKESSGLIYVTSKHLSSNIFLSPTGETFEVEQP